MLLAATALRRKFFDSNGVFLAERRVNPVVQPRNHVGGQCVHLDRGGVQSVDGRHGQSAEVFRATVL